MNASVAMWIALGQGHKTREMQQDGMDVIILLSMGVGQGENVKIAAEGPDEHQAVDNLAGLIEGGFGEI